MGRRTEGMEQTAFKPWKRGWYAASVVPEYTLNGGTTFTTQDRETQKPGQRQLQVCLAVVDANQNPPIKYVNYSIYYNAEAFFDDARLAELKDMAKQYKNGKWPDGKAQNEYITAGKLGEMEKALNNDHDFQKSDAGGIDVLSFMGDPTNDGTCDVLLSLFHKHPTTGYTEEVAKEEMDAMLAGEGGKFFYGITKLAPAGSMTAKEVKGKGAKA
jgi:hypothetical protein